MKKYFKVQKEGVIISYKKEDRPINDAMEHLSKHEGYPTKRANLNQMPKGIRYIGYFIIGCVVLMFLSVLVSFILN